MSEFSLLEYYQKQNQNAYWYDKFYKNDVKFEGTIYNFLGTNYRDIRKFEYYFTLFKNYQNIPRDKWPTKSTTGQEIAKQYVSNLVHTYLFSSNRDKDGNLIYKLTEKGKVFDEMLNSNFNENEKRFLILFLIFNASFYKTPRYIMKTANKVFARLEKNGIDLDDLIQKTKEFIIKESHKVSVSSIFTHEILWLYTFHTDDSFINLFKISDKSIKNHLFSLTVKDYKNRNKSNVLSWKYKGTNNQKGTTVDNYLILYLSYFVNKMISKSISFDEFVDFLAKKFSELYKIDTNKIILFIKKHKSIFSVIYKNIFSETDDFTENVIPPYRFTEPLELELNEKIDNTSEEGLAKLVVVRGVLKTLAKQNSNYRCSLEEINMCTYFTSKEEQKNYLEIHHFVPREFSYEFDDTIEFVENYVPLCPKCHRMIHLATDRERKGLINFLYGKLDSRLKEHNIEVDLKTLYEFYKIDE